MDSPLTAPQPQPNGTAPSAARPAPRTSGGPDEPMSTLRGAGVEVDLRRAGKVVAALAVVALAVLVVVFLVAGIQRNNQITQLRQHGAPVDITVTGCLGMLGGSGSNAAGYVCRGTFVFEDRLHHVIIPGNNLLVPRTVVRGVIDPGDPALFSTAAAVAAERASWRVFVVPALLLVGLILLAGTLLVRRRHRRSGRPAY